MKTEKYYTIPRTVRELQHNSICSCIFYNYTIPRTVRELQRNLREPGKRSDYTIPRTVRELQPLPARGASLAIIPYQELLGNYNCGRNTHLTFYIIPYQELLGNYNPSGYLCIDPQNYTIPRTVRELQRRRRSSGIGRHYTIPRTVPARCAF